METPSALVTIRKRALETLDAWLPRHCGFCTLRLEPDETGACRHCLIALPGIQRRRCQVCAIALPASAATSAATGPIFHNCGLGPAGRPVERCAACAGAPPAFDASHALADYAPPLDRLIHALKFGHDLAHARALGHMLAAFMPADLLDAGATLIPVPLAWRRLAHRGFNQSERIANALARTTGLPLSTGLIRRVRETEAQSGLALRHRLGNLSGAFEANPGVAGRHLLVVDDVMTSGATLQAVALALRKAGAARITNLVVARAP